MKVILTLILFSLSVSLMAAPEYALAEINGMATKGGIGLGAILAIVLSWSRNQSILWAIVHALFGWLYVIYFVFTR